MGGNKLEKNVFDVSYYLKEKIVAYTINNKDPVLYDDSVSQIVDYIRKKDSSKSRKEISKDIKSIEIPLFAGIAGFFLETFGGYKRI